MALTNDEQAQVAALSSTIRRGRKQIKKYDQYLEGEQPLSYMAPALEAEVGALVTQLVINWPRLAVEAYENRLDITGFMYPNETGRDPEIWAWWDRVDGEEQSQQAHFEALGLGRCFALMGSGEDEDDPPVLTIEDPRQVAVDRDPKNRRIRRGLYQWQDGTEQWANLYSPEKTSTIRKNGRAWVEEDRDEHELGEVPVVPIVHAGRLLRPDGRAIFHDLIPIADAANKMATDMMISGEFHAMPRRVAFGFTPEDFEDESGNPVSAWEQIAGRVWATEKGPKDADVKQFQEASLENFWGTIKLLAQIAGQLIGLPTDWLSFATDQPPSAESRRASESTLIKRAERMHTPFGGGWERVGRLFLRFTGDGDLEDDAYSLKTRWNDPATPTRAQQVDAVVKEVQVGILPIEFGREELGYDEEQRRRMAEADDRAARRSLVLLAEAGDPAIKPDPEDEPGLNGAG